MASPEILALAHRAQLSFQRLYADEIRHLIDNARKEAFDAAHTRVRSVVAVPAAPVSENEHIEAPTAPPRSTELRAARILERLLAQRIRVEDLLRRPFLTAR